MTGRTVSRWRARLLAGAALAALGFTTFMAWRLSSGQSLLWFEGIRPLGEFETFHVAAHVALCSAAAFLLGPRSGGPAWRWLLAGAVVLIGGVGIELAQVAGAASRGLIISRRAMAFDMGIDALGAGLGLLMLAVVARTRSRRR